MSKSSKKSGSDQYAPKPGTHAPKSVEKAQHRMEAWPESNSPGPEGHSNRVTSRQAASKYPPTATTSTNERAVELLKPQYGYRKPDIMR